MDSFDYADYVLRYDILHNTNNIFANGAFKSDDGRTVPIVSIQDGHEWYNPSICLGYATLEHREDGMVAMCKFADHDVGKIAKRLVVDTKEMGLSIYANGICYETDTAPIKKVLRGTICAVITVPMDRMPRPVKEIDIYEQRNYDAF